MGNGAVGIGVPSAAKKFSYIEETRRDEAPFAGQPDKRLLVDQRQDTNSKTTGGLCPPAKIGRTTTISYKNCGRTPAVARGEGVHPQHVTMQPTWRTKVVRLACTLKSNILPDSPDHIACHRWQNRKLKHNNSQRARCFSTHQGEIHTRQICNVRKLAAMPQVEPRKSLPLSPDRGRSHPRRRDTSQSPCPALVLSAGASRKAWQRIKCLSWLGEVKSASCAHIRES